MDTRRLLAAVSIPVITALVATASPSALSAATAPAREPTRQSLTASDRWHATLSRDSLDILLTNDDGFSAPGINAVYDALVADGHDVTMVAPATNQSGVSAKIDFTGQLTAQHPIAGDDNIWSVSTTPAGAVLFGLNQVLVDDPPDLVVSGTNVGSNTGFDTNFSGTVGAATVASGMYDIPAVAISTDTQRGGEATAAYDQTADLLVEMLDRGLPLLGRGRFLNINYPVLTDPRAHPKGIRYTTTDDASAAAFSYVQGVDDPTTWTIRPGRSSDVPSRGSDRDRLARGYVTVSVLDADRSVRAYEVPGVLRLIWKLSWR